MNEVEPTDAAAPWSTYYLARCREWDVTAPEAVEVFDEDGTSLAILTGRAAAVFHLSDGNFTLPQIIDTLQSQYADPAAVPADLEPSLTHEAHRLVEELGVLRLQEEAWVVEPEFAFSRTARARYGLE